MFYHTNWVRTHISELRPELWAHQHTPRESMQNETYPVSEKTFTAMSFAFLETPYVVPPAIHLHKP